MPGPQPSVSHHGARTVRASHADWLRRYAGRVRTLDEAVSLVRPDDRVMGGLPEPAPFLERLAARDDLRHVELILGAPRSGGVAAPKTPGIRLQAAFITQAMRRAGLDVDLLPVGFSGWVGLIRR